MLLSARSRPMHVTKQNGHHLYPSMFYIKHQHTEQVKERKGGLLPLRGGCKTQNPLRSTISLLHLWEPLRNPRALQGTV